jgi:coenzyme Q-binding protein COQ10
VRHGLKRLLPYTPEQLFDLVGDVEKYPQFVHWVTDLRTWNRRTLCDGVVLLDAEARVGFSFVRERFSTRVRLDRSALAIDVALLSGPFRRLENHWHFKSHEQGVELHFDIDFEFGSRILETLLAANMERAVTRLVACFEQRARTLYG